MVWAGSSPSLLPRLIILRNPQKPPQNHLESGPVIATRSILRCGIGACGGGGERRLGGVYPGGRQQLSDGLGGWVVG